MKYAAEYNPVSQEDLIDACERDMRVQLDGAKASFWMASYYFQELDADPEVKAELWNRFNATERRLMKDKEGKEWT